MFHPIPKVLFNFFSFVSFMTSAYATDYSSYVVKDQGNQFASNLASPSGETIPIHKLQEMIKRGIDLSDLDPVVDDVWNRAKAGDFPPSVFHFDVSVPDLTFTGSIPYFFGEYWFSTFNSHAPSERYELVVGSRIHNHLLRSALLKKLGYIVPMIKHFPLVRIQFENESKLEGFLNDMRRGTTKNDFEKRWIVKREEKTLFLQDVLIVKGNVQFYNLYSGFVEAEAVSGKRALDALAIPFSLVEIPESVNAFQWFCGRELGDKWIFPVNRPIARHLLKDSAVWILKELHRLKRKDFEEIARAGAFPIEVETLVKEKLIARVKSLYALNIWPGQSTPLKPITNITLGSGKVLKDGTLLIQKDTSGKRTDLWPGYGSRFAFGDFDDPFTFSEMTAYVETKPLKMILEHGIKEMNSKLLHTDVIEKLIDKKLANLKKDLKNYAKTGRFKETNVGYYPIPYIDGDLILSRDLVIGNYLGTDHQMQVAHSIGVSIEGGIAIFPGSFPTTLSINNRVGGGISRIYSHISPSKSIRESLRSPFKDFLVPLMQYQLADKINAFVSQDRSDFESTAFLKAFKNSFQVGESLVISDQIWLGAEGEVAYGAGSMLSISAGLSARHLTVFRTHIIRTGEDEIQVYRDNGNVGSAGIHLAFKAFIPFLMIQLQGEKGWGRVQFHQINLGSNVPAQEIKDQMIGLERVLRWNRIDFLKVIKPPYVFDHRFTDRSGKMRFLFFSADELSLYHEVDVYSPYLPEPGSKSAGKIFPLQFIHRVKAEREGVTFESVSRDLLYAILRELFPGVNFPQFQGAGLNDPAYSVMGSSFVRKWEFEGEARSLSKNKDPDADFVAKSSHIWKGFSASLEYLEHILNQIRNESHPKIYPENVLNKTTGSKFYNINLNLRLSSMGVMRLMTTPAKALKNSIDRYMGDFMFGVMANRINSNSESILPREIVVERMVEEIESRRVSFLKAYQNQEDDRILTDKMLDALDWIESGMQMAGIFELLGGQEVTLSSSMEGVRYGDEDGKDSPILSNVLGTMSTKYPEGPWKHIVDVSGASPAEFMIQWLLREF